MIDVGIVGGTGYTGVELLRLLAQHPQARVSAIHVAQGRPDVFPSLRRRYDALEFVKTDKAALKDCRVVFFATPHGVDGAGAPSSSARA